MDLVRHFLNELAGVSYRLTLRRVDEQFVLACFHGETPCTFAQLLRSCPPAQELQRLLKLKGVATPVPLGCLERLREALAEMAGRLLSISVAAEAERFRSVDAPPDFCVTYEWDAAGERLGRHVSDGAEYYGDGWFIAGDRGWQLSGIGRHDDAWLRRATIAGEDIPRFLGEAAADWDQRPVPCSCPVRLEAAPVLSLHVRAVTDDYVDVAVAWNVAPESIETIPSLGGYVRVRDVVRPGVSPQALVRFAPTGTEHGLVEGSLRLTGQDVPRFMRDMWPQARPWADGEVAALEQRHGLIDKPALLTLVAQKEPRGGIGRGIGVPMVVYGDMAVSAESLSRVLRVDTEFVRLETGWLPVATLRGLGIGPMGRLLDGTALSPVTLSPGELLRRGSPRLRHVWANLDFSALRLPQGATEAETAAMHLRLLLEWGIPGGLVGSREANWQALASVLGRLAQEHPALRLLVVGHKKVLDAEGQMLANLAVRRWDAGDAGPLPRGDQPGIVVTTPKGLDAHPDLLARRWDLLCLLEADSLVRSQQSRLYLNLVQARIPFVVGLFGSLDFTFRAHAHGAMCRLFRVEFDGDMILRYSLRDPSRRPDPLPQPVAMRPTAEPALPSGRSAEMSTGMARPAAAATPVPVPAPRVPGAPVQERVADLMARLDRQAQPGYETGDGFLAEARAFVERVEVRARCVPFRGYWPTYSAMTPEQQRWYFYWRDRVRQGEYPDTDLAYVFVHVYELINGIGSAGPDDGYEQLHQLWRQYRDRLRQLDSYLIAWLADFAVVYGCSAGPLRVYAEAAEMGLTYLQPDTLIAAHAGQPLSRLPLALIENLCDHKVRDSKFYTGGHRQHVEEGIPRAIEAVDRAIRATYGGGILELFKPSQTVPLTRSPFRGARYAGDARRVTLAEVPPYSDHPPLREFLTGVVKHGENCLRQRHGYSGRLRGYTLDADIVAAIEEALLDKKPAPPPKPRPVVQIDLALAEAIARESDQVRDMLLVGENGEEVGAEALVGDAAVAELNPGHSGTPVGAGTSAGRGPGAAGGDGCGQAEGALPPDWAELAATLVGYQLVALAAIAEQRDVAATVCAIAEANATMPAALLDEINELAVDATGDIIIDPDADPPAIVAESVEAVRRLIAATE
ncbi:MAG: TerB N-terminal domain-containing protein [Anaerolineae bacterium]